MQVLKQFMAHFGISPDRSKLGLLSEVASAFSRLPYENLTKIIKLEVSGSPAKSRRGPAEVIGNHISWGAGGTCFSLTSALMHLVRSLGWEAEYLLADRPYGQDTHCALLVWIDGRPHLLDPGFLIVKPIAISGECRQEIATCFNRIVLAPAGNEKISLSTFREGKETRRLTYKTQPVDSGQFLKAWDASFGWEMMRYPLLTRVTGAGQIYLNGTRLQINRTDSAERGHVSSGDLISRISAQFGINPSVVERAISILRNQGETIGQTSER
jgi:arylamine N-acetyltransferase